jgi:phosphate transport system substrate-binding protein
MLPAPADLRMPAADPEHAVTDSQASLAALWLAVILTLGAALLAAVLLVDRLVGDTRPPFVAGEVPRDSPLYLRSTPRPAGVLYLAGSGSNIPLTRAFADTFHARSADAHVVVFDSIGDAGGVRAVYDDVIDLGLVSRPLTAAEAALDLFSEPYARVPVVVAAHLGVPDASISVPELLDIYAGRKTAWSDGTPVVVLQRQRGDTSHLAVAAAVPEFEAVNDAAYRESRWRVVDGDQAMQEALSITPGAVGLFDLGVVLLQRLPVRPLRIDDIAASEASVQSGRYPFYKELELVSVEVPGDLVAEFIRHIHADESRALMRAYGYIPLPEDQ